MEELKEYGYWKVEAAERKWVPYEAGPDSPKSLIKKGAMFSTWCTFSHLPEEGKPEPVRRGFLPLDFDHREDAAVAVEEAKTLLLVYLPEIYDVDPYTVRIFLTGSKGVHLEFPPELFGAEDGDQFLPLIYKQIALDWKERFSLGTLDESLYCMGKGKMWRLPGVRRKNGKYKTPVATDTFRYFTARELLALTAEPREIEAVDVDLKPNEDLNRLYQEAKQAIYSEKGSKEKREAPTPPDLPLSDSSYALSAMAREVQAVMDSNVGSRNTAINKAAYSLAGFVASGLLDKKDVESRLLYAGIACGLLDDEINKAIASGFKAGMAKPRDVPAKDQSTDGTPGAKVKTPTLFGPDRKPYRHKRAAEVLMPLLSDLRFDPVARTWLRYKDNYWQPTTDHKVMAMMDRAVTSIEPTMDFSVSYLSGIAQVLSWHMLWPSEGTNGEGKIPFKNGLLDLKTMKLEDHKAEHFTRWILPFNYDASATCEPVKKWLLEALIGDALQVELVRAYLNAIVTGRHDLQRFLELVGAGGSGKGTITRLAVAIVGRENVHSTQLRQLEYNRFEMANLYEKRLCLITDAEASPTDTGVLKAVTGGDELRYERKHKQVGATFVFKGMVLVASNSGMATTDTSSGLQRRRITVRFDHVVPPEARRDLDAEFEPHLPGVLSWVLSMKTDEVTFYLRDTGKAVRSLSGVTLRTMVASNPVAAWLHDDAVYKRDAETPVGRMHVDEIGHIKEADSALYPNYCQWCRDANVKALSLNLFVPTLKDLLIHQLKLAGVKHKRNRDSRLFVGIGLRVNHEKSPSPLAEAFGEDIEDGVKPHGA